MKIGILGPSEIAFRRFMPAVIADKNIEFAGVAINSVEERYGVEIPEEHEVQKMLTRQRTKANKFFDAYGGELFESYEDMVNSEKVDAIYIPLPPGMHYTWAKKALLAKKHVLVEKPATIRLADTETLLCVAEKNQLALHENYMFIFHSQIQTVDHIISSGELGELRLLRLRFGFPMRQKEDFRYNREMGGGALLDAGGYVLKYADYLLGGNSHVVYAKCNSIDGFDVDMFGSGMLANACGLTAQIAFGMDNDYKCELEVWGSRGSLLTGRILTAPAGFEPEVIIRKNGSEEIRKLSADDAFKHSIRYFKECIKDDTKRKEAYGMIHRQAILMDEFYQKLGK